MLRFSWPTSLIAAVRQIRSFRTARQTQRQLQQVRDRTQQIAEATDEQLQDQTSVLQQRVGKTQQMTGEQRVNALALVTEAVRRTTGKTYYDVQLQAGLALTQGAIAEMQTGEGKTLTTALPAFVGALYGRGIHVATTNAYLSARDCEEVRPSLELLGMTVGLLPDEHDPVVKKQAYGCDVTWGTGYEFGFDFLRDQIAIRNRPQLKPGTRHLWRLRGRDLQHTEFLQRPHAFAIVDEADSVLIDEATMPLILSSAASDPAAEPLLHLAKQTAESLAEGEDYEVHRPTRRISLTEVGLQRAHHPLYQASIRGLRRPWTIYIDNALRAKHLLQRDVDYVVLDGKIQIVDQNTGRIHDERSWRDGLHQAVELREAQELSPEKTTDGRISRQRYFRFYDQVCGMTGTASGNEAEFERFYDLPVIPIPTHRPSRRDMLPTRCFINDDSRNAAIVQDVLQYHESGRPVLIGTRTIAHSQQLHVLLEQQGLQHSILNGLQDEDEARVIERAGRSGAVCIATNMAGRGTDIKPDTAALKLGGLHVIAAEHNLSYRVDRQLAGRAARQGDPGSARFYAAAEDEIFAVTESILPDAIRTQAANDGESKRSLQAEVRQLQDELETRDFERRQQMFQHDHWMESVLETLAK